MDKLTVVIPTYNRANYLKETIQGVLEQFLTRGCNGRK